MGVSGTEVAIAASDVVLLDDNFASIVKAALWGRNIFNAIRKFLQFQLTVNVVAVTLAFIGSLSDSHGDSPLTAVQLLWVNLIMDSLAALSLATELPTPDLLNRKPVGRNAPLITRKMWRFIVGHSIYQLAVTFTLLYAGGGLFGYDTNNNGERTHLYTIIFNVFVLMQLVNEINARLLNDELNMFANILKNRFFIIIGFITFGVQVLFVEVGGSFTSTSKLLYYEWFICIALGLVEIPLGVALRFVPITEPDYNVVKVFTSDSTIEEIMGRPTASTISRNDFTNQKRKENRWSLVRKTVTKIAVINAFKSMGKDRPYRVVRNIDEN